MKRTKAIPGSLVFFVLAPCVMGGLMPWRAALAAAPDAVTFQAVLTDSNAPVF